MDKYHKLFIKASLIYLVLGGALGMLMSFGVLDPGTFRFAHVHINLLGFVVGLIVGVAYHILPRFNGVPLKYPDLVNSHYYISNVGLVGMIIFYTLKFSTDSRMVFSLFFISAVLYLISIGMFAVNLWSVLIDKKIDLTMETVNERTRALDVIEKWPGIISIFNSNGLEGLDSFMVKVFQSDTTIKELCDKKKVDMELLLATVKMGIKRFEKMEKEDPSHAGIARKANPTIKRGDLCSKDILVGDLLKVYPETNEIFEKHYGESCFNCPGQAFESIEETANMHNASIDEVLAEVNDLIKKTISS